MVRIVVAAVMVFYAGLTSSFPHGAPADVCSTNLMPIHGGNEAQPSAGPYTLAATSTTYSSNKPITVVLKGSGHTFKGFVIQAQDVHTGQPISSGEWRGPSAKQLPCAAVTHVNPASKSKVELTWTPKGSGEVVFLATVVESYDTFYTGIKSSSRIGGGSANSFYDRDQKTRASSTYATSATSDQDAYQPSNAGGDYYETAAQSNAKEDDDETAAAAADTQEQYDSNYYAGGYDPNGGYSQPDYTAAASSAAASGTAAVNEPQRQQQHDQASYYPSNNNNNYQFQNPSYSQFHSPPQRQYQQPAPSFHSQRFAPPDYRQQFQPFRAPWNYPRF